MKQAQKNSIDVVMEDDDDDDAYIFPVECNALRSHAWW